MKKMLSFALALCALAFTVNQASAQGFQLPNMQVHSSSFPDGGIIPLKYTSHGDNVLPEFTFTGVPDNAVALAVIFHDIEVAIGGGTGDVTHWIAWNIPVGDIKEGMLPSGTVNGKNMGGRNAYMGPGAPYRDRYHHYVFEFYALNAKLDLPEGASRDDLMAALQGKVVAKASYVGRYANAKPQQ